MGKGNVLLGKDLDRNTAHGKKLLKVFGVGVEKSREEPIQGPRKRWFMGLPITFQ